MSDILPIGAVVMFEQEERRCRMVIVAQSPEPARDPEMLYFAVQYRGDLVYVGWPDLPLYSLEFLSYHLESGWTVGNADRHLFTDTCTRVRVLPYAKKRQHA